MGTRLLETKNHGHLTGAMVVNIHVQGSLTFRTSNLEVLYKLSTKPLGISSTSTSLPLRQKFVRQGNLLDLKWRLIENMMLVLTFPTQLKTEKLYMIDMIVYIYIVYISADPGLADA